MTKLSAPEAKANTPLGKAGLASRAAQNQGLRLELSLGQEVSPGTRGDLFRGRGHGPYRFDAIPSGCA